MQIFVDSSILIQIVNFVFLIWALNLILYKPIRNILKARSEKFKNLKSNIDINQRQLLEKKAAVEANVKEARVKGVETRNAFIEEAKSVEKEMMAEVSLKFKSELEEVRKTISADVDKAKVALEKEVNAISNLISEKILGRAV